MALHNAEQTNMKRKLRDDERNLKYEEEQSILELDKKRKAQWDYNLNKNKVQEKHFLHDQVNLNQARRHRENL